MNDALIAVFAVIGALVIGLVIGMAMGWQARADADLEGRWRRR